MVLMKGWQFGQVFGVMLCNISSRLCLVIVWEFCFVVVEYCVVVQEQIGDYCVLGMLVFDVMVGVLVVQFDVVVEQFVYCVGYGVVVVWCVEYVVMFWDYFCQCFGVYCYYWNVVGYCFECDQVEGFLVIGVQQCVVVCQQVGDFVVVVEMVDYVGVVWNLGWYVGIYQ